MINWERIKFVGHPLVVFNAIMFLLMMLIFEGGFYEIFSSQFNVYAFSVVHSVLTIAILITYNIQFNRLTFIENSKLYVLRAKDKNLVFVRSTVSEDKLMELFKNNIDSLSEKFDITINVQDLCLEEIDNIPRQPSYVEVKNK